MMSDNKNTDAVNTRLATVAITNSTIKFIKEYPTMHRGSVRFFTGHIYTDKQYEKLRKAANKRLP
jgi:hypothetical protein